MPVETVEIGYKTKPEGNAASIIGPHVKRTDSTVYPLSSRFDPASIDCLRPTVHNPVEDSAA